MDLILWRHAEAENTAPDHDRALTRRGQAQAAKVAAWLRRHAPEDLFILVSPTLRTRQTALALEKSFSIEPALAPGADSDDIIRLTGWPDAKSPLLIVGHQPTLGEIAAQLMTGQPQAWSIKKGAVWWLRHRERGGIEETVLQAALPPSLI